jgi:hypothetical protein
MYSRLLLVVLCLLSARIAKASISEAAALFLVIPMDIRSRAMGEAGVALPDLAFALDVNPALLAEAEYVSAGTGGGDWLPELAADLSIEGRHAAFRARDFGIPLSVGAAYKTLDLGRQLVTNEFGETLGEFSSRERAITLGLAIKPVRWARIGYATKAIWSQLSTFGAGAEVGPGSASVWAHDFGFYIDGILPQATLMIDEYKVPNLPYMDHWALERRRGFSIGLSIQNLGRDIAYIDAAQADPLPRLARVGASYRPFDLGAIGFLLSAEVQRDLVDEETFADGMSEVLKLIGHAFTPKTEEGDVVRWGAEINLLHIADFRFGHLSDPEGELSYWTYGFGIGIDRLQVNYAKVAGDESTLSGTHMWGVALRW